MDGKLGRFGYLMFWFGLITSMSVLIMARITDAEVTDGLVKALATDTIIMIIGAAQYIIWGGKPS